MRVVRCIVALCLVVGTLAGCSNSADEAEAPASAGKVAVIDLDLVAQQLGRDVQMANSIKQREESLNQTLSKVRNNIREKLDTEKEKVGDAPTPEEAQSLQSISQQASLEFTKVMQNAKTNLSQHRAQVIRQFREEVRPIAQQVAKDNGLSIVVTKNDSVVFAYESAVDITGDVVSRLRQLAPAAPAAHTASQPGTSQQR